ncbi:hypothetical protein OIU80_19335 [Flavobacterium sp. LS1R47]|uniref:Uncharacterized protein n=1 Tax=Flavobacterium frigoritolerans TaxID=2987686 RepID=A0A9X3CA63_9FLAO|nr:hypothetical protein [Flavobacterium frigoritolerans]MCV9934439.1 hypothetical protein [Flavobacterium frigoritolerans]
MNGNFLKEKLQLIDVQFVELSKILKITPQSLNSRFKTKDVTISFLIELCEAVKKSPYYFIKGSEYERYFTLDESVLKEDVPVEGATAISDKIRLLEEQNDLLKENLNLYKDRCEIYKDEIAELRGNTPDRSQTA